MDKRILVAKKQDVQPDQFLVVSVEEREIAICQIAGCYYAFLDVCSHQQFPLSEGDIIDGQIICLAHGSIFDPQTGLPLTLPATEPLIKYEVIEEGEDLFIEGLSGPTTPMDISS